MTKPTLWEYALLHYPKDEKEPASVICVPTMVLASEERHVQTIAARAIPDRFVDRIDEVTIVVRPF